MENKIVMEFPQENDTDLYLNVFGHSITEPLHKAGPAVKTGGRGRLLCERGTLSFEKRAGVPH